MRWPFFRKRQPQLIVVPGDEVVKAARLLARHRTEADHALIMETTLRLRCEMGLPMPERHP